MDINYELYKVFYHVATTLSFSEASKRLYISQSAVSQSIKSLEKKLGQNLFNRNTKKVQLTPEGEMLLNHIEPAMNFIRKGEMLLLDASATGGQLRIGASDTICRYFLVPFIEKFHRAFPSVHIKVTNATSIQCVELLKKGQVDFIVINAPNNHLGSFYSTKKVKAFKDVFIANHSFAELEGKKVALQELLSYPLLMLEKNSTTSEFLHSLFRHQKLELIPEAELGSNDLLIDLAQIGLGITCVPDYCLPEMLGDLFILDIKETFPTRELVVAHNPQLPLSKSAESFLSYFEDLSSQKS